MKKRKNRGEAAAASPFRPADRNRHGGDGSYIVGMGARPAGLEAFEQFFAHLPPDTGLAFVLVPHLEPTHKGMMPELLGRHTKMKVVEAADGMEVRPNCVYVIPPNADLAILHGRLQVLEPAAPRGLRTPIDFFFRHLAADQKEKAIGVILSGMGSDGTLGLRAIKENFGMVMVQDPASAKYRRHAPQRHQHRAGRLRGRGRSASRQADAVRPPRAAAAWQNAISAKPSPPPRCRRYSSFSAAHTRQRLLLLQDEHHQPPARTPHERPPVRQPGALRAFPPGEPAGSRAALQGVADRRDRLLPRSGDVRLPQGEGVAAIAPRPAAATPLCGFGTPRAPPARRPTRWPSC